MPVGADEQRKHNTIPTVQEALNTRTRNTGEETHPLSGFETRGRFTSRRRRRRDDHHGHRRDHRGRDRHDHHRHHRAVHVRELR